MEEDRRTGSSGLMRFKLITGATATAFVAVLAVVYRFSPTEYSFYPRCPWYAVTHWLCPGCGATRALHSLLHADWNAALHYNALFTVLAPIALAWGGFCFYHAM